MISSGRCHGPGCQQDARAGDWCGEVCNCRSCLTARNPGAEFVVSTIGEILPAPPADALTAAVEAAQPEVERRFAELIDQATTQLSPQTATIRTAGAADPIADILAAMELVRATLPVEPVKLTRDQLDSIRRHQVQEPAHWQPGGPLGPPFGVPFELVDTEEESTPYLEQWKRLQRAFRDAARQAARLASAGSAQVAPEDPQVGWFRRWLDRWRRA